MYVVQATFQAKPGKAQALIDKFKAVSSTLSGAGVVRHRILVDHIADFWTVIFEVTVEDLEKYFAHATDPKMREGMAGYMDLVQSGNRRVYRIAAEG